MQSQVLLYTTPMSRTKIGNEPGFGTAGGSMVFMFRKRFFPVLIQILIFFVLSPLGALPPGLAAMTDDFQALRYNPAALSQNAATGLALGFDVSRQSDGSPQFSSVDFFMNTSFYAHQFHIELPAGTLRQRLGFGFPIGDYFSLGAAAEFEGVKFGEMDIAASFLLRPVPYISIGAQGGLEALKKPFIDFSLALRPFTDHVTIGVGSRFDGELALPSLLAVIEPVNGIRIDGGYNFQDSSWHVGFSLSASVLRIGDTVQVGKDLKVNSNSSYIHLTPRVFESIISEPPGRFVRYDIGTVVDQRHPCPRLRSGSFHCRAGSQPGTSGYHPRSTDTLCRSDSQRHRVQGECHSDNALKL